MTVQLDSPIEGIVRGADMVAIDDPAHLRPSAAAEVQDVPDEIVELARAGGTMEAIKRYRVLNGATLERRAPRWRSLLLPGPDDGLPASAVT